MEILGDLSGLWREEADRVLRHEVVATGLSGAILEHRDYIRLLRELNQERQSFQAEVTEANHRIKGWLDWYEANSAEVATLRARLEEYEAQYGPLDSDAIEWSDSDELERERSFLGRHGRRGGTHWRRAERALWPCGVNANETRSRSACAFRPCANDPSESFDKDNGDHAARSFHWPAWNRQNDGGSISRSHLPQLGRSPEP